MEWLYFALATILFYSLFDFFLKISSDKISSGFGAFLINIISAAVVLVFLFFSKMSGEKIIDVKPGGILYTVLAGISIGIASIVFIKMFATGTNISIGVPLVRIGIVVLASLLGILVLKEGVNLKYIMGFILSIVGIYFIITSK